MTTTSAAALVVGTRIVVEGASQTVYDGQFTVISVIDSTHFTYTRSSTPTGNGSGSDMTWAAGGTLDNTISRADGLQDLSTGAVLEADSYLGLSTVVQRAHPQTGIELTYIKQAGDHYQPPVSVALSASSTIGLMDS